MSGKHSQGTTRPTDEQTEHFQRLRSRRLSVHRRDEPKHSPEGTQSQPSQTPVEIVATHHANLGTGRRRSSAFGTSDTSIHGNRVTQVHRRPLPEKPGMNPSLHDMGIDATGMASIPGKSELGARQHTSNRSSADTVPSRERPNVPMAADTSTVAYEPAYLFRQNAEYFDVGQDGVIWPRDTYKGCRKLGWGIPSSSLAMLAIHSTLSYPTCPGYMPDRSLRIRYDNTHHGKNGDNSSSEQKEHRRSNEVCESILTKYDGDHKGGMTFRDVQRFWSEQRSVSGFCGWSITGLEWLTLYLLLWPRDGVMHDNDIRAALNGSILYNRAEERQRKVEMHRKQAGSGGGRGNQLSPVKLAVALISGLALLIWALRDIGHNYLGWGTHWWNKDGILRGARWTNPELHENW
ncbi:Caleosin related protein-domain-containing protein [Hypoxylon sp. FL1857]|nr:Caleosin related protein-domain-containing protein [Hypoxylon sp. FL1857]